MKLPMCLVLHCEAFFFFVYRSVSFSSASVDTPKKCQGARCVLVQAIFTKAVISLLLRAIEAGGIYFAASVRACLVFAFTCESPFTFMLTLKCTLKRLFTFTF